MADYSTLTEQVANDVKAVRFTITDIGSDWIPTEVQQVIEHRGRREKRFAQIGVRLSPALAAQKGKDPAGDPYTPHPAWIVGWTEPSVQAPYWTMRLRVDEAVDLRLEVTRRNKQALQTVAVLTEGSHFPGDYEFVWDAAGLVIKPGQYFLMLTTDNGKQPRIQRRPLIE